jgi:ectoine hydroxylase-related dioxygenase (phytanoyl-CoA dioxygenase family)
MPVLTTAQKESFYRDGYLRFGKVLEAEQVETLRAELTRVTKEEQEREDYSSLPPEFAYGHDRKGQSPENRGVRAIHQFVNMWKVSPIYAEITRNPIITAAIRELVDNTPVRVWHDQIISKPPGDNAHFQCHHDFYFWPLDHPTMITCWLALDDATPENGCMHVVPGSHRDPRFQPADCELKPEYHLAPAPLGAGEPASLYQEVRTWMPEKASPVLLKAGECMFHHCLNYHLTPHNVTDRQRRAFVIIYMPDGTCYKEAQSPNHPCTNYLNLPDGAKMEGENFPLVG